MEVIEFGCNCLSYEKICCNFTCNFIIMTKALLKQNITKQISKIDDENFLKAVFTIVSNKADESFELDGIMKKDLDTRKENNKKGKSRSYTWQEVKKAALSHNG